MRLSPHRAQADPSGLITQGPTIRSIGNESSAGPLTAVTQCLVCPLVRGIVVIVVFGVHLTHVSALSGRITRIRIRPVIRDGREESPTIVSWFPAAFPLSALACWSSFPAKALGLPHGRLTGPRAGPRRRFRVSHARAAIGVGALSTPGTVVLALTGVAHRPAPAASQRHVRCTPPQLSIYAGLWFTKHQPRVHACSPVRSSPRPSPPDKTAALRLSPELRTPGDARPGGDRSSSTDMNQRSTSST